MSGPLFVHRFGRGRPVIILLHGLGASGRYWRLVARLLGPHARVVCPDILGFGRSPRPAAGYTVADHLATLDATLNALDLAPAPIILAGHSTGAVLALEWAAARPDRFAGLGLLSLPAYRSDEEARACIGALSPLAWATVDRPDLGELICGVMCAARPLWQAVMPLVMRGVPADIARDMVLHNWVSYSNTLTNVVVAHRVTTAAARLVAADVPVHLLHGDRDRTVPVAVVRALAAGHGWPLTVLARQPHTLPLTAPDSCADLLRGLVRDVSGGARLDQPSAMDGQQ